MSKSSINNDQFLRYQGIEVEESHFLKKVLEKKSQGNKEEFNLRDQHGRRLSKNWRTGDTFWSVLHRAMIQRVVDVFDPDTYSKENAR
jgi:hypothetical protein